MPIRRIFFDWDQPALRGAADYLWSRYGTAGTAGTLDLERLIVAVPGGRAGRRLLEELVRLSERQSAALVPPRIVTAGQLPELLYEVKRPFAGDLAQQLAWTQALKATRPKDVAQLIKRLPAADDLAGWLALGQTFSQLHRELAADALDFSHVLRAVRRWTDFWKRRAGRHWPGYKSATCRSWTSSACGIGRRPGCLPSNIDCAAPTATSCCWRRSTWIERSGRCSTRWPIA